MPESISDTGDSGSIQGKNADGQPVSLLNSSDSSDNSHGSNKDGKDLSPTSNNADANSNTPSTSQPIKPSHSPQSMSQQQPPSLTQVQVSSATQVKRFICTHEGCDKSFAMRSHLERHQRTHSALRPFKCPIPSCKAAFNRHDNMLQHHRAHVMRLEQSGDPAQMEIARAYPPETSKCRRRRNSTSTAETKPQQQSPITPAPNSAPAAPLPPLGFLNMASTAFNSAATQTNPLTSSIAPTFTPATSQTIPMNFRPVSAPPSLAATAASVLSSHSAVLGGVPPRPPLAQFYLENAIAQIQAHPYHHLQFSQLQSNGLSFPTTQLQAPQLQQAAQLQVQNQLQGQLQTSDPLPPQLSQTQISHLQSQLPQLQNDLSQSQFSQLQSHLAQQLPSQLSQNQLPQLEPQLSQSESSQVQSELSSSQVRQIQSQTPPMEIPQLQYQASHNQIPQLSQEQMSHMHLRLSQMQMQQTQLQAQQPAVTAPSTATTFTTQFLPSSPPQQFSSSTISLPTDSSTSSSSYQSKASEGE